jgi:hypothetical protein
MRKFLSPNHPGTGIQAFMLAKMLALSVRESEEIKELFEFSKSVLITALGPNSELVIRDLAEFKHQVIDC